MDRTYYVTLRYFDFQEHVTGGYYLAKFWESYGPYAYVKKSDTYIDLEYYYDYNMGKNTLKIKPMKGDVPAKDWLSSIPYAADSEFGDWWRSHTEANEEEEDADDGGDYTDSEG